MQTITIDGVQIPTEKLIAAGWKAPEEKKSVVWNPEIGQEVYYLDFYCGFKINRMTYVGYKEQKEMFEYGYCYRTMQDALRAADVQKAIVRVNRRIEELNDGWVVDWDDRNQKKFYIFYDYKTQQLQQFLLGYCEHFHSHHTLIFMASHEVAKKIISEMSDDLCVIWGISNEKK